MTLSNLGNLYSDTREFRRRSGTPTSRRARFDARLAEARPPHLLEPDLAGTLNNLGNLLTATPRDFAATPRL